MKFESILDRWSSAERDSRQADDEIGAAMALYRGRASADARTRLVRALERRARARDAVMAVVREVERSVPAG